MNLYYFINANNEQKGPVEPEQLLAYGVTRDTQVWTQGMPLWRPAGEVAELAHLFIPQGGAVPPPFNNPQMPPQAQVPPQPQYQQSQYQQNQYQQPQYQQNQSYEEKPNTWLVWSILSTIFCCLPLGIAGIVYANKVDTLWYQGHHEEARKAASKARMCCLIALGSGLIIGFFYFIIGFLGAL